MPAVLFVLPNANEHLQLLTGPYLVVVHLTHLIRPALSDIFLHQRLQVSDKYQTQLEDTPLEEN